MELCSSIEEHLKSQPIWVLILLSIASFSLLKSSISFLNWVYINFLRPPKNLKKYGSWALGMIQRKKGAIVNVGLPDKSRPKVMEKKRLMTETQMKEMFGMGYSVTRIKREKNDVVYAVFENLPEGDCDDESDYLIYKFDSAGKDDGVQESVLPIETLRSGQYPYGMSFFSVGSKIYFFGGSLFDSGFSSKAFMFDTNSNKGTVSIQSMKHPKPSPMVFGPVDDDKVYVFSGSVRPSFEMLNTSTNTWKSLEVPPRGLDGETFHSSALCGTNILISSGSHCLFVFCTRSETWRKIEYPVSSEPYCLPFIKARPLFHGTETVTDPFFASQFQNIPGTTIGYFLASQKYDLPELYSSTYFAPVKIDKEDYDPVGHFLHLGEVESLMAHMSNGWIRVLDFFTFNDSLCIFCAGDPHFFYGDHFSINICDFSCSLQERVKVKVVNSLQFKLCSNKMLIPKHIHVVT